MRLDGKISLSFIPAVSLNKHDKHSFIQYILAEKKEDGSTQTTTGYVRFPVHSFRYQHNPFIAFVGESRAVTAYSNESSTTKYYGYLWVYP